MIIKSKTSLKFIIFIIFSNFSYCSRCCSCCRLDYVKRLIKKFRIDLERYDGNKYLAIKNNYDTFLNIIKNLDEDQKWRMMIDGVDQGKDKYVYEKANNGYENGEPGYLKAMLDAWDYMISTLDQEIEIPKDSSGDNNDMLLIMHEKACNNVSNMLSEASYYRKADYPVIFGISDNNQTADELSKYCHKLRREGFESEKISNWYVNMNENRVECCDYSEIEATDDFKKSGYSSGSRYMAHMIFKVYYEKLYELKNCGYIEESFIGRNASYEDKLLELITRTICLIVRCHVFPDGNGRLCIYLLLNKLLIENKMLPVILWEPHEFVIKDVFFAIKEIKDGQNNFCRMVLKGKI